MSSRFPVRQYINGHHRGCEEDLGRNENQVPLPEVLGASEPHLDVCCLSEIPLAGLTGKRKPF
jgi:hypothetical protein